MQEFYAHLDFIVFLVKNGLIVKAIKNVLMIKKDSPKSLLSFFFIGFFLLPFSLRAQQEELNVLFVGNSYTYGNNLAHVVSILSEGTKTKLFTRKSVIGGANLVEHWNGERGLNTREIIREGGFDIVVLQDYSLSAIETPDSLLKYVRLFAGYNAQYGAKTYLYNTWAREKVPQFQEEIDEIYTMAARENNIERVPVGSAWEMAMDIRPTIDLHTADGSHATPLGTLLTACVFVRAICGELPAAIPRSFRTPDQRGETVYLFNINPLDAEFCLRITAEIFQ